MIEKQNLIKIVNSWLKDISAVLGFELKLDSEGVCTFQIKDDVIAIEVSDAFPMVYIYSSLLVLPKEDKDLTMVLMARALELNAFQIITRGGSIASAPGGGILIYCYSSPIENIDSEKFSHILGAFYETLPELRKLLTESPKENLKANLNIKKNSWIHP